MVNLGTQQTKILQDGWTVVTLDGRPSAHAEHTIAITEAGTGGVNQGGCRLRNSLDAGGL